MIVYSSIDAASKSLTGDVSSLTIEANDPAISVSDAWSLEGSSLVSINVDLQTQVGPNWISVVPINSFSSNGQTAVAGSSIGDGYSIHANPNGGFGFGPVTKVDFDTAYRVHGLTQNACSTSFDEACHGDLNGDSLVGVDDLLLVIGSWGQVGDGTFRPIGDIAPMPSGDCIVNVEDLLAAIELFNTDCNTYGACCLSGKSCEILTFEDCSELNGSYEGDGTFCEDTSCVEEVGACCLTPFKCVDSLTQSECIAFYGQFQGENTACAIDTCEVSGDHCSVAVSYSIGQNAYSTIGAFDSGFGLPDDTECEWLNWEPGTPDTWGKFTPDSSGIVDISLCNSNFDTSLVIYQGDHCGQLAQIACNGDAEGEDGCQQYYSAVYDLPVEQGEMYFIRISGWNSESGSGICTIDAE